MTIAVEEPGLLAHTFTLWDGTTIRSSPDERDVLGVAKGFNFQTDEHGFGPSDLVLPRPDAWDTFDSAMLAGLETRDAQGRQVYRGRVVGRPRTGVNEVTIQTEGYSKHADDDTTAKMIFRDMDQSRWVGADVTSRINLLNNGFLTIDDPKSSLWGGSPALALTNTWNGGATLAKPMGFAEYNAGGVPIGQIYVAGAVTGYTPPNASIVLVALLLDAANNQPNLAIGDASSDLETGPTIAATFNATTNTRKWAVLEFYWGAAATATGGADILYQWNLMPRIYGAHGLTKRGTEPTSAVASEAGFYVSDMVPYIVNRWCPLWATRPDSIEPTSFVVPQATYTESGTTAGTMLDALAVFGGDSLYPLDWFVYDVFYLRSPGNYGNTYTIRRDEGSDSLDQGPDVTMMLNGVQVSYDPGDGTQRTVGPPGSGSDLETAQLLWTDQNHPANKAGLKKWAQVTGGVMTVNSAILLGQLAMTARNNQGWRGSITQRGRAVRDTNGNVNPAYMMRALEQAVIEDDPDTRPRRIVGTAYNDKDRSVDLSIGQRPDRIDQVLARAGVEITNLPTSLNT